MRQTPETVRALPSPVMQIVAIVAALAAAAIPMSTQASAGGPPSITLTLKNHRFTPSTFQVPTDQKVRITLVNQDPAAEEFDSHDLRVEQVVTPNATISFTIGPLKAGQYSFMGEFHAATAQGQVVAR